MSEHTNTADHDPHATIALPPPDRDISSREDIAIFVTDFYRDVAMDDLLGPIFDAEHVHWAQHVDKLTDFWAWQLIGERGYEGNPLLAHVPIDAKHPFSDAHFARWLEMFTTTIDLHYVGPTAQTAKQRAAKMASAMQRLLHGRSASADHPITPYLTTR